MTPLGYPSRRQALKSIGCGFGFLSAAALANQQAAASVNPLAEKASHFAPRAKRVIFLFMQGGPSQVDTFDYKSRLAEQDGQMHTFDDARVLAKTKEIIQHRVFQVALEVQAIRRVRTACVRAISAHCDSRR